MTESKSESGVDQEGSTASAEASASDQIQPDEAKRLFDYLNDVPFAWVGNGTLAKLRRISLKQRDAE